MNTVPKAIFVNRMLRRWCKHGNYKKPTNALMKSWRRNNGVLNAQLDRVGTDRESQWDIIQERAGIGKSESVIVQCAELGLRGHHGALIVVKLSEDADDVVQSINTEAGQEIAIAIHSKTGRGRVRKQANKVSSWPTVVLCHASFKDAMKLNGVGRPDFWNTLLNFDGPSGTRSQIIVDESLDIVEIVYLTEQDIDFLCGALSRDQIRNELPPTVNECIEGYREQFNWFARDRKQITKLQKTRDTARVVVTTKQAKKRSSKAPDFGKFLKWADTRAGKLARMSDDAHQRVRSIINAMNLMNRQFVVYERRGGRVSLGTARSIVPPDSRGVIVMDATGALSPAYDLMPHVVRYEAIPGTRKHNNVTLHIGYSGTVGKQLEKDKEVMERLVADLNVRIPKLTQHPRVLFTVHKGNEEAIRKLKHNFDECFFNHYGQIDGKNEWSNCNNVVIGGLHFRTGQDAVVSFMAFKGTPDSKDWFRNSTMRVWKQYKDIKRAFGDGWTTTAAVQAGTRGTARTVIDAEGNCGECHIWLQLPKHNVSLSKKLIAAIEDQLPGVRVKFDWDFSLDGSTVQIKADSTTLLMDHIETMKPGTSEAGTAMWPRLKITRKTWGRLMKTMADPESRLGKHAASHGVSWAVKREGKHWAGRLSKAEV